MVEKRDVTETAQKIYSVVGSETVLMISFVADFLPWQATSELSFPMVLFLTEGTLIYGKSGAILI